LKRVKHGAAHTTSSTDQGDTSQIADDTTGAAAAAAAVAATALYTRRMSPPEGVSKSSVVVPPAAWLKLSVESQDGNGRGAGGGAFNGGSSAACDGGGAGGDAPDGRDGGCCNGFINEVVVLASVFQQYSQHFSKLSAVLTRGCCVQKRTSVNLFVAIIWLSCGEFIFVVGAKSRNPAIRRLPVLSH
jgi:hypothetical protein